MATSLRILDSDLVRAHTAEKNEKGRRTFVVTLFWGDQVKFVGSSADGPLIDLPVRGDLKAKFGKDVLRCVLSKKVKFRDTALLKTRFVDVGQGDGCIVELPNGRLIIIDGGEESHMHRYLSTAFRTALAKGSIDCRAIVVTHGDADHFAGLIDVVNAKNFHDKKKPFVTADAVYHNGLVKKTSSSLGRTTGTGKAKHVVDIFDDLRTTPDAKLSPTFKKWKDALKGLRTKKGKKPKVARLEFGDDDVFADLANDRIKIQVLGPIVDKVKGRPALRWLQDAGHTINGHSVVLRLTYDNVRILMGADLNIPSEERLLEHASKLGVALTAEVLKVPHHGSHEFSPRMLEAVRPVVSFISSGDENAAKEYIHPRAGLVGALGKFSRGTIDKPLIYVSEMIAFFQRQKKSLREYKKTSFGILHIRTDGTRVLAVTNSGRDDRQEAYAFKVNERGEIAFEDNVRPI